MYSYWNVFCFTGKLFQKIYEIICLSLSITNFSFGIHRVWFDTEQRSAMSIQNEE